MSRKRVSKSASVNSTSKSPVKIEKQLIENLIELQKVHTNLLERFDKLASEISTLLSLFELAARSFAKSPAIKESAKDHEFLEKIDRLLDQNKTIAKGLSLMEEKIRERMYGASKNSPQSVPQSLPQEQTQTEQQNIDMGEYQPSLGKNRPLPRF